MFRVGLGEDSHRIGDGGKMVLGGVEIECGYHLIGHSDADVLLHAITDAILGAAGMSDIGTLFPNTDPANHNRSSAEMLEHAVEMLQRDGWQINNVDCVVHSEIPKISQHRSAIIESTAKSLGISPDQVFVKGKTGESTGPIGRREIAEARCVALLSKVADTKKR